MFITVNAVFNAVASALLASICIRFKVAVDCYTLILRRDGRAAFSYADRGKESGETEIAGGAGDT